MTLEVSSTSESSGFFGPFHMLFYDSCHLGLTVLEELSEAVVTISYAFRGVKSSPVTLYGTLFISFFSVGVQLDYSL